MTADHLANETASLLAGFGIGPEILNAGDFAVTSPIDGSRIAALRRHTPGDLDPMIAAAQRAFLLWRGVPPPRRGELVRLFAEELRRHKPALGRLVSIEAGKILEEGQGEVQEMIDICDFAVGLSRQLYGKSSPASGPVTACSKAGTPWGRPGSSPPSTSRSRCGRGTRPWRWSAATR
jgi:aldehyde dehydrogenase (NAD+)